MLTSYDIIHTLVRTEKGLVLESQGQYVFEVARKSNKIEITKAVEEIYNVKVDSVNVMTVPGKRKRVRKDFGHTASWKKAIVTLKDGHSINVT